MPLVLLILVCCLAQGCQESAPRGAPPQQAHPVGGMGWLAQPNGLRLIWMEPHQGRSALILRDFAPNGACTSSSRPLRLDRELSALPSELRVAGVGDELAVAWVAQTAHGRQARLAVGKVSQNLQVHDLGEAATDSSNGSLALLGGGTTGRLLLRGPPEPCEGQSQARCRGVSVLPLPLAAAPARPQLSVPEGNCPGVGLQLMAPTYRGRADFSKRWHYSICSRQGAALSHTVFSIEPRRQYAQSQQVLQGCELRGAASFGARVVLFGRCSGSSLRAAHYDRRAEQFVEGPWTPRALSCTESGPVLEVPGGSLRLSGAQLGLEHVLPDGLAPPGAQAAWAGEALLVAHSSEKALRVSRYECKAGGLRWVGSWDSSTSKCR